MAVHEWRDIASGDASASRSDRDDGGADRLTGSVGNDALGGGPGKDIVVGGAGNDALGGGSADDLLLGGAGNDRLYGHAGADQVRGEGGDDVTFSRNLSRDRIRCDEGADRVYGDTKDVPRLALKKLSSDLKLRRARPAASSRGGDCEGEQAHQGRPDAPGATDSGTDSTSSDDDAIFGESGDEAGCETPGGPDWTDPEGGPEQIVDDLALDFGTDFDDTNIGDGFDDFDDAFGDDQGGERGAGPGPRSRKRNPCAATSSAARRSR